MDLHVDVDRSMVGPNVVYHGDVKSVTLKGQFSIGWKPRTLLHWLQKKRNVFQSAFGKNEPLSPLTHRIHGTGSYI